MIGYPHYTVVYDDGIKSDIIPWCASCVNFYKVNKRIYSERFDKAMVIAETSEDGLTLYVEQV